MASRTFLVSTKQHQCSDLFLMQVRFPEHFGGFLIKITVPGMLASYVFSAASTRQEFLMIAELNRTLVHTISIFFQVESSFSCFCPFDVSPVDFSLGPYIFGHHLELVDPNVFLLPLNSKRNQSIHVYSVV